MDQYLKANSETNFYSKLKELLDYIIFKYPDFEIIDFDDNLYIDKNKMKCEIACKISPVVESFIAEIYENIRNYKSESEREYYFKTIANSSIGLIKKKLYGIEKLENEQWELVEYLLSEVNEVYDTIGMLKGSKSLFDNGSLRKTFESKTFEGYFEKPEYIDTFLSALKEADQLTDNCKLILKFDYDYKEILAITNALYKYGYLSTSVAPIDRKLFADKLGIETPKDGGNLRKIKTPTHMISTHYENIIPNINHHLPK